MNVDSIFILHIVASFLPTIIVFRLLKQGYSIDDIANCTIEAERIRCERAESISSQKWDKVNEISEGFVRVLRKAIPGAGVGGPKKVTVVANSA